MADPKKNGDFRLVFDTHVLNILNVAGVAKNRRH